jgi:hypothetical protein
MFSRENMEMIFKVLCQCDAELWRYINILCLSSFIRSIEIYVYTKYTYLVL